MAGDDKLYKCWLGAAHTHLEIQNAIAWLNNLEFWNNEMIEEANQSAPMVPRDAALTDRRLIEFRTRSIDAIERIMRNLHDTMECYPDYVGSALDKLLAAASTEASELTPGKSTDHMRQALELVDRGKIVPGDSITEAEYRAQQRAGGW